MSDIKHLSFSGNWRVLVLSAGSTGQHRVVIKDASNDGTIPGTVGSQLDVVGVPDKAWSLRIQVKKGSSFVDSRLRVTSEGVNEGKEFRIVGSADGTEDDFDDLVVRAERPLEPRFVGDAPLLDIPQGARGIGVRARILDGRGQPVPLRPADGITVRFILAWVEVVPQRLIRGKANPGPGRVVDAAAGIVGYVSQPGDFDLVGRYQAEFWIQTADEAFAYPAVTKIDIRVVKTIDRHTP